MRRIQIRVVTLLAGVFAVNQILLAQTPIKLPKNKYTPAQDVELGQRAAAEVRKQYPIIEDAPIAKYLATLGDRLVAVAPANLKEPVYRFSFTPVNLKEINAFALPGGPMFVNRGMFDAAASEGEVVGVMAHELSHVLLRHGTANITKAQNPWLQLGQIAGAVGGSVVGGSLGSLISDGTQFGLGTLVLRYSRDFEKQADLLGVQIMAKAGYDPRALARMFETISRSSAGGAPQWLSSHPDPGNRSAYIVKEASALTVAPAPDSSGFPAAKGLFARLAPPESVADLARRSEPAANTTAASTGTPGQPVPPPASEMRTIDAGVFQVRVPRNWVSLQSSRAIRVVPHNGYGQVNGRAVFTHGVEFGVATPASRDLSEATSTWLMAVARDNPNLQTAGQAQYVKMSGRTALAVPLSNPSELGGTERIVVYTTFLADGSLFYFLTLAPEADAQTYQRTFVRIGQSLRLTDVR